MDNVSSCCPFDKVKVSEGQSYMNGEPLGWGPCNSKIHTPNAGYLRHNIFSTNSTRAEKHIHSLLPEEGERDFFSWKGEIWEKLHPLLMFDPLSHLHWKFPTPLGEDTIRKGGRKARQYMRLLLKCIKSFEEVRFSEQEQAVVGVIKFLHTCTPCCASTAAQPWRRPMSCHCAWRREKEEEGFWLELLQTWVHHQGWAFTTGEAR